MMIGPNTIRTLFIVVALIPNTARCTDHDDRVLSCEEVKQALDAYDGSGASDLESAPRYDGPFRGKTMSGDFSCFRIPNGRMVFSGVANFAGATFEDATSFAGAIFEREAVFTTATFKQALVVDGAIFRRDAFFDRVTFEKAVTFRGSAFEKKARFTRTTFKEPGLFIGSVFEEVADFSTATFQDRASILHSAFNDEAVFHFANFRKELVVALTTFTGNASFFKTTFSEGAMFSEDTWGGDVLFAGANATGRLVFGRTRVLGRLLAQFAQIEVVMATGSRFGDVVDFSDATLQKATLDLVEFDNECDFIRTQFTGPVSLNRVKFRRSADFREAKFGALPSVGEETSGETTETIPAPRPAGVQWSYVDAADLRIDWFSSGLSELLAERVVNDDSSDRTTVQSLPQVLEGLRETFRRRAQREDYNAVTARMLDDSPPWDLGLLGRLALGAPSRWGTDLRRVLCVSLTLAVLLTLALLPCNITRVEPKHRDPDYHFRLRLTEPFVVAGGRVTSRLQRSRLWLAAGLSFRSFFKVGFGYTYKLSKWGRRWATLSWVLGLFMLAHFVVTIRNTVPLVNLLLGGFF